MKRLIKYASLLFALVLSASIIGGCLTAGVSLVRMIVERTTESSTGNETSDWWYWDGDGKFVFSIGNSNVVTGSGEVKSGSEQFSATEISSLYIDVGSAELVVDPWENDYFLVEYENIPVEYEIYTKENTLIIDREANVTFVWNVTYTEPQKIHVSVPASHAYDEVYVDKGSGSTKLTGIRTDKLNLDTGSGGINIADCVAKTSIFNSGSGSFVAKNCELGVTSMDTGSGTVILENVVAKNLKLDTGSGRVEVKGILTGKCVFEAGSGSLNVVVYGREEDYNFRSDMGSGNFYVNGKKKDKDYEKEDKSAKHWLIFDAGSGRVSVDFKDVPENMVEPAPENFER